MATKIDEFFKQNLKLVLSIFALWVLRKSCLYRAFMKDVIQPVGATCGGTPVTKGKESGFGIM